MTQPTPSWLDRLLWGADPAFAAQAGQQFTFESQSI